MPWLHFYEKNSQKIEIVLFMLGLAHMLSGLHVGLVGRRTLVVVVHSTCKHLEKTGVTLNCE